MTCSSRELVLCSAAAELPPEWLPEAGVVPLDEANLYQYLDRLIPLWLPRSRAEHDVTFKQWIPYVLLLNPQGHLAAYCRAGTETRLHGRYSLGIGGHINPCDALPDNQPFSWALTVRNCLRRELAEEYPGACRGHPIFLGLIHESLTPVGKVHLGLVFQQQMQNYSGKPGPELNNLDWIDPKLIGRGIDWPLEGFELWSQLALQLFNKPLVS